MAELVRKEFISDLQKLNEELHNEYASIDFMRLTDIEEDSRRDSWDKFNIVIRGVSANLHKHNLMDTDCPQWFTSVYNILLQNNKDAKNGKIKSCFEVIDRLLHVLE